MILNVLFFLFALTAIASGIMVILSHNPVRAVLFLIFTFFNTAALWLLAQAEFLALTLVLVYVGAVMTLFLFVLMMMNIEVASKKYRFVKKIPVIVLGLVGFGLICISATKPELFQQVFSPITQNISLMPNVNAIGQVLYTEYFYAFEVAGVLLLVAIMAAISLAYRGPRSDSKVQDIDAQLAVNVKDRVQVVKMPSEPWE